MKPRHACRLRWASGTTRQDFIAPALPRRSVRQRPQRALAGSMRCAPRPHWASLARARSVCASTRKMARCSTPRSMARAVPSWVSRLQPSRHRALAGPRGVLDGRWGVLSVMQWRSGGRFDRGPRRAVGVRRNQTQALRVVSFHARSDRGTARRRARPAARRVGGDRDLSASVEVSDRPRPRDRKEAILSHQLAAALALLDRPIVPHAFEAPDAVVRALAERVHVRHDPTLDADYPERWPHRSSYRCTTVRAWCSNPISPLRPMQRRFVPSFARSQRRSWGAPMPKRSSVSSNELDRLPDVKPLLRLLRHGLAEAA